MLKKSHFRAAIAVSLGAIAGALCRYYLSVQLTQLLGIAFPWGTFGVNLAGCFLMGFVTAVAGRRWPLSPELLLLLTTGFLGSYTTFSSYVLETALLSDRGDLLPTFAYWLGSPLLGIACLLLGTELADGLFFRWRRGDRP
ncbi:MAG: fluoride efflux transporter CrcB [Leptolyngbyaceae cyanobacterium]